MPTYQKKKKKSIKIGKNTYVFPPQLKSGSREQESEKIDKRKKKIKKIIANRSRAKAGEYK